MSNVSITADDLIRYLYGETNSIENQSIKEKIEKNWALKEKFSVLKESFTDLQAFSLKPSTLTIEKILKFAVKEVLVKN